MKPPCAGHLTRWPTDFRPGAAKCVADQKIIFFRCGIQIHVDLSSANSDHCPAEFLRLLIEKIMDFRRGVGQIAKSINGVSIHQVANFRQQLIANPVPRETARLITRILAP